MKLTKIKSEDYDAVVFNVNDKQTIQKYVNRKILIFTVFR